MTAGRYMPPCPVCPGHGVLLGTLGAMRWFRCRHCGWDFGRRRRVRPRSEATAQKGVRDAPERDHNPA